MKRFWLAAAVALVCVAALPRPAVAGYPGPGRDFNNWYACTSDRVDSATEPWSEPMCEVMPWFNSQISEVFSWDVSCGGAGCSVWRRVFFAVPIGVSAFSVSCQVSDVKIGSGTLTTFAIREGHGHITTSGNAHNGNNLTAVSLLYTTTHTSGLDLWSSPEHDPVLKWQANNVTVPEIAMESFAGTSQSTGGGSMGADCVIVNVVGQWQPGPTPTPVPTINPTATPFVGQWPTPEPWPTFVWPTVTPWINTPEPPVVWVGEFTPEPDCYRILPDFSYNLGAFGYTQTVGIEPVDLCLDEQEFALKIYDWDFGEMFWFAMAASAAAVVYSFFRR